MILKWNGRFLLLFMISGVLCQDPCLPVNHRMITADHWRSTGHNTTGTPYCDLTLPRAWYRFNSGARNDLATACPSILTCNTLYPVWTPDNLPTVADNIKTLRAMRNNPFGLGCNDPLPNIRAKNCSSFNVYELQPILSCPTAYCIGFEVPCPANTTSPNGFTPGCHVENITIKTTIQPAIKAASTGSETLVFNCIMVLNGIHQLTSRSSYKLEVEFHASMVRIYATSIALPAANSTFLELERNHWTNFTNGPFLGHNMSCKARLVFSTQTAQQTWHWYESDEYFAGIKVSPASPGVKQGHSLNLTLQSTVPISDFVFPGFRISSVLKVHMENPAFHLTWSSCGNVTNDDLIMEATGCGVEILSSQWNTPVKFLIKVESSRARSAINHLSTLRFKVVHMAHDQMYSNYILPDIQVNIIPARNVSMYTYDVCRLAGDPYVRTFDGLWYSHQYEQSYLIVQDVYNDIQIHGYFQSIFSSWTSVCALAIKSGGDVFVADVCFRSNGTTHTASYPPVRMSMRGCSSGNMKITTTSTSFQVYLPNGMRVSGYYRWDRSHMDVNIYPSALSFGRTVGLCGTFDGNLTNDLLHRDGVTVTGLNLTSWWNPSWNWWWTTLNHNFSTSWALPRNESLFFGNFPRNLQVTNTFCECPPIRHTVTFNNATCGSSTTLSPCYDSLSAKDKTSLFLRQCGTASSTTTRGKREIYSSREKRQVVTSSSQSAYSDFDDEFADAFDPYIDPSYTVKAPQWRNGWTNALATTHCTAALSGAQAQTALNVSGIEEREYMQQCVMDIKTSGNTSFVELMVERLIWSAHDRLLSDTTQWSLSPSGVLEPPFQILNQLCLNDCSKHGSCVGGSCVCTSGYIGDNCSKRLIDPPLVLGSARRGLCDTSKRPCQAFTLYGREFNENNLGACRVTEIELDGTGKIVSSSASQVTTREVETAFKSYCWRPQLSGRKKRSASGTGVNVLAYQIQSSNNGVTYSGNTTIIVIDSTCMDCNTTTLTCSLKNNTCYIGGQCQKPGDTNLLNTCEVCDPSTSQHNWTAGATCQVLTGQTTTPLPVTTGANTPLPTPPATRTNTPTPTNGTNSPTGAVASNVPSPAAAVTNAPTSVTSATATTIPTIAAAITNSTQHGREPAKSNTEKYWWGFLLGGVGLTLLILILAVVVAKKKAAKNQPVPVNEQNPEAKTNPLAGRLHGSGINNWVPPRPSMSIQGLYRESTPRPKSATSIRLDLDYDPMGSVFPEEDLNAFGALED